MDIEQLKRTIHERTQIPCELLTCSDQKTIMAQARQLAEYRKTGPKTTRERFAEALQGSPDLSRELDAIEAELKYYPSVNDGGSPDPGDGRSKLDRFAEYIHDQLAFDPWKDGDGWR